MNPKETQLLRVSHVNYLDSKSVLSHLKYLPSYLLGNQEVSTATGDENNVLEKASDETQNLPKSSTFGSSERQYIPAKRHFNKKFHNRGGRKGNKKHGKKHPKK